MRTRAESAEVWYPGEDPVVVDGADVDRLKHTARSSPLKRARLCTHQHAGEKLHEMLITLPRDAYVRPHLHVGKSESFTILQGEADLLLFDVQGNVTRKIPMGSFDSGKPFYYRTDRDIYHTLVVRTESLVLHEVTDGPFRREQTVFAPWAPDGSNAADAVSYITQLCPTQP